MSLTENLVYYLQLLQKDLTVLILVCTMTLQRIPCMNIFKCDLCQVLLIPISHSQTVCTVKMLAALKHLSPCI